MPAYAGMDDIEKRKMGFGFIRGRSGAKNPEKMLRKAIHYYLRRRYHRNVNGQKNASSPDRFLPNELFTPHAAKG